MSYDFNHFDQKVDKALGFLKAELSSLRTGRATVSLLDSVKVEAYGALMSVSEVASLTIPDPALIVIKPWDRSLIGNIEKAIMVANLNLSPIVDGEIVRVPVPALTTERRQEMVKLLAQKVEAGRVLIRNIRAETKQEIESQKHEADVSEDDIERELVSLETKVKEILEQAQIIHDEKEKELLTI